MLIDGTSAAVTNNCLIDGFTFEGGNAVAPVPLNTGGAIYINGKVNESSPTIKHCIFKDNNAQSGGAIFNDGFGGNSSPKISNCLFFDNTSIFGGAIYNHGFGSTGTSSPDIINCTFVDNVPRAIQNDGRSADGVTFGTSNPKISNSIFSNNDILNLDGTGEINFCLFEVSSLPAGATGSNNHFNTSPNFENPLNNDFHVSANSTDAISGGSNVSSTSDFDLDGNPRIQNTTIDIGVYEYNACRVIYVDSAQVNAADGKSWNTAYPNLQDALVAAHACDILSEIWIAKGTYRPTARYDEDNDGTEEKEETFYISKDVKIYGGFVGTESSKDQRNVAVNKTILCGDLNGDDSDNLDTDQLSSHMTRADNANHVIVLDGSTVDGPITDAFRLDGVQVQNGNSIGLLDGGGILHKGMAIERGPVFNNCTFFKNSARDGGAVYTINNDNDDYNIYFSNTIFNKNLATRDGAALNANALGIGGGIDIDILACTLSENEAGHDGGAIFTLSNFNSLNLNIDNSIIHHNKATNDGGAISFDGSDAKIDNSTFTKNTSGAYSNDAILNKGSFTADNSIFWNNGQNHVDVIENENFGDASFNNCILQDGSPGNGSISLHTDVDQSNCLDLDPLFIDTTLTFIDPIVDLRVKAQSPAVDLGNNSKVNVALDFDNRPRILNSIVDAGAYEYRRCGRVYVDSSQVSNIGTGTAWYLAYPDLQAAIDQSCYCDTAVVEVWVAKGTYKPTKRYDENNNGEEAREESYYLDKDVKIYGGFAGTESDLSQRNVENNKTILSGDLDGDDVKFVDILNNYSNPLRDDNAYHVLYIDGTQDNGPITDDFLLDGLYIRGGNANVNPFGVGAIYFEGESGKYEPTINDCHFTDNSAYKGGSLYYKLKGNNKISISNCTFQRSYSQSDGGVMYFEGEDASDIVIENCHFFENQSNEKGGAIYTEDKSSGILDLSITNCLFNNNESTGVGKAIFLSEQGPTRIEGCTFSKNGVGSTVSTIHNQGGSTLTAVNSIFWKNGINDQQFILNFGVGSLTTFTNCLLQDGSPNNGSINYNNGCSGIDNLDVDPFFIDTLTSPFDFRLAGLSPAINKGLNSEVNSTKDLDGNIRIDEATVDMGAYEYIDQCPTTKDITDDIGTGGAENLTINASDIINANITIKNNSTVTFNAGFNINLNQGFEVELGSTLIVQSSGCGS